MSNGVIFDPSEASKGVFQSILKVQGKLVSIERKPSKFEPKEEGEPWQKRTPSDQAEVMLEDTAILQMEEGVPEPELKEGRFTFWMTYAQPDAEKPGANTWFVKYFLASGIKLGIFATKKEIEDGTRTKTDWVGKFITLERKTLPLFKRRDEAGVVQTIEQTNLVFVGEDEAGLPAIDDYARTVVVGKNKSNALRSVLMDNRVKQYKDIVDAVRDGSIDKRLGLYVDKDGIFQVADEKPKAKKK